LICFFQGNVNVELFAEPLSGFYVGGTSHLNSFDSKRLFKIVETALPDTASRPMAYEVGQPQTLFAIVGNWRREIKDVVRERMETDPNLR